MKSVNYTIRPPETTEEWEAIPGLLRAYHQEFDDDTCFTSFDAEMADIQGVYTAEGTHFIIAIDHSEKKIAGCIAMRTLAPGVAEMKRLYIVPEHRGKKLGKKLAEEIITYAGLRKYKKMVLDTMHTMEAAQKLYQLLGFTLTGPYNHQDPLKVVCYEKKFT